MAKAMVHPLKYSGEESSSKISKLRAILHEKKVDALVVSALDEIACTVLADTHAHSAAALVRFSR